MARKPIRKVRGTVPAEARLPGRLEGKLAVVTGASRGIGLAIATALAAEGCDLALLARTSLREDAEALVRSAGVRVVAKECDVRDARQVESFFAALKKRFPRVHFLVNNAGRSHAVRDADQLPIEDWEDVMATNLTGMFLCTRAALPLMGEGSVIVNNLSVAARIVFAGESAYVASKWGARGFTNCLREELRPRGIRVLGLMPGPTATGIWEQFWPEAPREKMMDAATVADAVVHALTLPPESAIEEIVLGPTAGQL